MNIYYVPGIVPRSLCVYKSLLWKYIQLSMNVSHVRGSSEKGREQQIDVLDK